VQKYSIKVALQTVTQISKLGLDLTLSSFWFLR